MDPRYQQYQPSNDEHNRLAPDAPDVDSPLAAERFSRAADRITRKMDKVVERKPQSDRAGSLRFIGIGIVVLAIVAVLGTIVRYRVDHSPAPTVAIKHQLERPSAVPAKPVPVPTVPAPTRQLSANEVPRNTPPLNQSSVSTVGKKPSSFQPGNISTPTRPRPGSYRKPEVKHAITATIDTPYSAMGDDEPDIDNTITFYEPVNRSTKSGSFNDRRSGAATTTKTPVKRNRVKMTASLAAKAGGTLDEVLEHNGTYYKVKLTLPVKRIEYFKKSLAAQDGIAMLSVTAESTTGGTSIIILEMNTR